LNADTAVSTAAVSSATANVEGLSDASLAFLRKTQLNHDALQAAILNSRRFAIIATDEYGVIQLFNIGAERMLGYRAVDVVNKLSPADLHDPLDVVAHARALGKELSLPITAGFEALVYKASRDIEDVFESGYICKDGSRLPVVVSTTALRGVDEALIGYLQIGTDNSERARVELALNEARVAADRANLAKSDFLSGMSHELRTPLNAILGFAQLLESGAPPPTPLQTRSINQIVKAGWYLLDLINEILDLSLVESGKLGMSCEPVLLSDVMQECRSMFEPQASKRDIGMDFPEALQPIYVSADRTRLKQVMINLLSNAIKYNKVGGSVTVAIRHAVPGKVRISVCDTGLGIVAASVEHLFEPFNRLGKEGSSEEGTGIGLVMTKRLVELMGGTIGVATVWNEGSEFWVELGTTAAPALVESNADQPISPVAALAQGHAKTVLYIEDNPANLELVAQIIARRTDLHLLSAADGQTGIEIACLHLPDVILMDINLPGIDGTEAMQRLTANPATAHIPIIALSANAMPRDIEKGVAAGFFEYITKPIKVVQFMDALNRALAMSNQPLLAVVK